MCGRYLEKSSFCCWHTEDLSCSILPSLRQSPSRRRWKSRRKKFWERAARAAEIQVCRSSARSCWCSVWQRGHWESVCLSLQLWCIKGGGRQERSSLIPVHGDQGEETLTCRKGASDMKGAFSNHEESEILEETAREQAEACAISPGRFPEGFKVAAWVWSLSREGRGEAGWSCKLLFSLLPVLL